MKFQFVNLEQRSPEWFAFRKGKIGASMAPTILGDNPFKTQLELWEEMVFGESKVSTPAMQRGIELEPEAIKWANSHLDCDFKPVVLQSKAEPDFIASLDGYCEKEGTRVLLEVKCPRKEVHEEAVNGNIPKMYYAQLQHQMDIADVPFMYYLSFDGNEGAIVTVERDQKYCDKLFFEEKAFLDDVVNIRPPTPSDRDFVKIHNEELIQKAKRLSEIKELVKNLEKESKDLSDSIIPELFHPRCIIGDMKVQKVVRKGNVDYAKIEVLKGLDLEPYRKSPSSYWKFG